MSPSRFSRELRLRFPQGPAKSDAIISSVQSFQVTGGSACRRIGPSSRSVITATASAPASMTSGAVSSVMPPIATTGSARARARAPRPAARRRARRLDRAAPCSPSETPVRSPGSRPASSRPRAPARRCASTARRCASGRRSPARPAGEVVLADVHAVGAGHDRAMSARSLTMNARRLLARRRDSRVGQLERTRRRRASWRAAGPAGRRRSSHVVDERQRTQAAGPRRRHREWRRGEEWPASRRGNDARIQADSGELVGDRQCSCLFSTA